MTQQMQQQQFTQQPDARLSSLETRVEGISGTLNSVLTAISNLNDKIDRGRQTPWAVIWSALGVMMVGLTAVGTLAYTPVKSDIGDLKAAVLSIQERADKRLDNVAEKLVTRAEHEREWKARDDLYNYHRDRMARIEGRIDKRLDRLERSHFKAVD